MPDEPAAPEAEEEQIVRALAAFPDELARLLDGQPGEALRRPGSDGGWSVVENLCHLRDWEEVFLERVRAVLTHDRPELPAYDDSLWEIERDYKAQDPLRTLAAFAALRRELVELLGSAPRDAWEREGVHGLRGPVSVRWLALYLRDHDREHDAQIREALS